jgi:CRP/FNR family cyclic AMP-dependent transcriptional regulator
METLKVQNSAPAQERAGSSSLISGAQTAEPLTAKPPPQITPQSPGVQQALGNLFNLEQPQQILKLNEGDYVFKAGDKPQGLYSLKSGAVKIVTHRPLTRGRVSSPDFINRIVAPGEFFGLGPLIKGTEYSFFARALRASEVYVYPKEVVTQFMSGSSHLLKSVFSQMTRDLEINENTSQLHYLASVQERISYQLALLAERLGTPVEGGGLSLSLRLTRNELAQLAGTINESLSRHLTELKNEGIIDLKGREIIVKNLPALKEKSGNFDFTQAQS